MSDMPGADAARPGHFWANRSQIVPAVIFAICIISFMAKGVTSMVQKSSTWDETHYFGLGKYLLREGRWDVPGSILHPPLSFYLHSVPLLFVETDLNVWKTDPALVKDPEYLGKANLPRGQALLSSPANRDDWLLNGPRCMMLLTGVLLAWFVYRWSYQLYGPWAAVAAIVLCCFCPNILAHARLITPDITVTTFSFGTIYYLWKLLREGRMTDAMLGGLCLGLALLSKFTALLLLPIATTLIAIYWWKTKTLKVRACLIFAGLGLTILCLGYRMDLEPFFAGIQLQLAHAQGEQPSFLFGEYSLHGWWYYFLLAFLIKTPIALLLSLGLALFLTVKKRAGHFWTNEVFLIFPVIVIFCFFSASHHPIGLRYILPIYPFLFVFASGLTQTLLSRKSSAIVYLLALGWYVGASTAIHPHYLAYFNELTGGPGNGYKYLVDSSLDWGQDLKGLGKFMREKGIPSINLSYFGTDSPQRYGISYHRLPSLVLRDPDPPGTRVAYTGWFAISATNLQGTSMKNKDTFASFRNRQPVATIGYSILIYKIDD